MPGNRDTVDWRLDEKGIVEICFRLVPRRVSGTPGGCDDNAECNGASPVGSDGDCGYRGISGCPQRKRRKTMTGMWLYILGLAVAGLLIWKFVPDDKRQ
jgi:hypothetical protein